jgi:hypothetical protein
MARTRSEIYFSFKNSEYIELALTKKIPAIPGFFACNLIDQVCKSGPYFSQNLMSDHYFLCNPVPC